MPVFLERFVLAVLTAIFVGLVLMNALNFDWPQRVSGGLAVLCMAYFVGHTVHKSRVGPRAPAAQPEVTALSDQKTDTVAQPQPVEPRVSVPAPQAPPAAAPVRQHDVNGGRGANPAPVTVNAPGGVVSVNQQGGITANTVIVGSQVTYRVEPLRANVADGDRFRTEFRIRLNSQAAIGELRIGVYGAHVVSADVQPYDAQGPMQIQFGQGLGVQDGLYVVTIQNAYRGYTLVVFTSQPEELHLKLASA